MLQSSSGVVSRPGLSWTRCIYPRASVSFQHTHFSPKDSGRVPLPPPLSVFTAAFPFLLRRPLACGDPRQSVIGIEGRQEWDLGT